MELKDRIKKLVRQHKDNPERRLFEAYGFADLSMERVGTNGCIRCICPECEDSRTHHGNKDCSINPSTGVWHCYHCGASGYVMSVKDYRELTVRQRAVENRRNSAPKADDDTPRPEWVPEFLAGNVALGNNADRKRVLAYMTDVRKISVEVMQRAKVTLPDVEQKDHCREVVIQFNFWDRGVLVNWKQRTMQKGWRMFAGGKILPYHIDAILHKEICYVTEGEIDTLSMMEAGFPESISVPTGGASHLTWLDEYYDTHFADKKKIYIAADFDEVGGGMIRELVRRLGAERCFIVYWDEDCKDANEELQKYGTEGIQRCVEEAEPVPLTGIVTVRDQNIEQNLDRMIEYGLSPGCFMGLRAADEKFRFEAGRFVVVTGVPGDGKSELVDEFTLRMALLHGWKAAYFSPENTPVEYHLAKLVSKLSGTEFRIGRRLTSSLYDGCKRWLSQNIFHIMPDLHGRRPDIPSDNSHRGMIRQMFEEEDASRSDSINYYLDDVLGKAREAVQRMGVRQIIIDPFNSIERDPDHKTYSDKDWALHVCNACRNFANHYGCLVYLVAHPRKMDRALLDGRKRRVEMNDIAGAADFGNKCDYCIVVDRNDDSEVVTVYVDKVKFKQNGSRSKFTLHYDMASGRYTGCTVRVGRAPGSLPDEKPVVQKEIDWYYFNQTWVDESGNAKIRTYLTENLEGAES